MSAADAGSHSKGEFLPFFDRTSGGFLWCQHFFSRTVFACEDGHGAETSLGDSRGRSLLLTLGITRIVEQESLDVSIWGSADGHAWQLLASFPRKFYCGIYSMMLDLSRRCEIRYLRAHWRMGRWGGGESKPLAGFYLSLCTNGSPANLTSRAHSRRLRAAVTEEAKIQVSGAA